MSILRRKQEERRGQGPAPAPSQIPEYFIQQDEALQEEGLPPLLRRRLGKQGDEECIPSFSFEEPYIESIPEPEPEPTYAEQPPRPAVSGLRPQRFHWNGEPLPPPAPTPEQFEQEPRGPRPGFRARAEGFQLDSSWEADYEQSIPDNVERADQFQEQLDSKEVDRQLKKERRRIIISKLARVVQWLLIGACLYIAFLIYGVIVTSYEYDAAGNIAPQRMTVEELAAVSEFREVQGYYLRARSLYEQTLELDFRLANNPEAALLVASEYELLLEDVAKLSVDLNAAQFSATYAQLHRQLLYWVQTDIAVYLQNISAAISQNSAEKGDQAIIGRDIMYNDFMLISENIAVYGRVIKGANLGDIYDWSPDRYVREVLEGVRDE